VTTSLQCLKGAAPDLGVVIDKDGETEFEFHLAVPRASGRADVFNLRVQDLGAGAFVFEVPPYRLPRACVERHINHDGSFCLGWTATGTRMIIDVAGARMFWVDLDRFLQYQLVASDTGRWPDPQNARAHGSAAVFQDKAEQLAAQLGPSLLTDLKRGNLTVCIDRRWRQEHWELLRNSEKIARMRKGEGTLSAMRAPCPCDASKAVPIEVGACGNHAELLARLTSSIYHWRTLHATFVRQALADGQQCCGAMENCELKARQTKPIGISAR
jgi:hypothetical protein